MKLDDDFKNKIEELHEFLKQTFRNCMFGNYKIDDGVKSLEKVALQERSIDVNNIVRLHEFLKQSFKGSIMGNYKIDDGIEVLEKVITILRDIEHE